MMKRGQTQEFELPDDLVIGVSDEDSNGRMGAGSTLPQDLFPLGVPGAGAPHPTSDFADTRPSSQPDAPPANRLTQAQVVPAAPEVAVTQAQPIIAPMLAQGRMPQDGPRPKRVLVADDDATARLYMRSRLMLRGHLQLTEATSGLHALKLLETQRFDAVLLDVDMGEPNGYDVCKAVRSHVRKVGGLQPRIYMISSRSGMLDKMRAKMAGADAFLSKPPHPGQLAELLAQL